MSLKQHCSTSITCLTTWSQNLRGKMWWRVSEIVRHGLHPHHSRSWIQLQTTSSPSTIKTQMQTIKIWLTSRKTSSSRGKRQHRYRLKHTWNHSIRHLRHIRHQSWTRRWQEGTSHTDRISEQLLRTLLRDFLGRSSRTTSHSHNVKYWQMKQISWTQQPSIPTKQSLSHLFFKVKS